jgi:hypothetical protein
MVHTQSFAVINSSRPSGPPKQQFAEVFGVSILRMSSPLPSAKTFTPI